MKLRLMANALHRNMLSDRCLYLKGAGPTGYGREVTAETNSPRHAINLSHAGYRTAMGLLRRARRCAW